jgi:hypothetical protein
MCSSAASRAVSGELQAGSLAQQLERFTGPEGPVGIGFVLQEDTFFCQRQRERPVARAGFHAQSGAKGFFMGYYVDIDANFPGDPNVGSVCSQQPRHLLAQRQKGLPSH